MTIRENILRVLDDREIRTAMDILYEMDCTTPAGEPWVKLSSLSSQLCRMRDKGHVKYYPGAGPRNGGGYQRNDRFSDHVNVKVTLLSGNVPYNDAAIDMIHDSLKGVLASMQLEDIAAGYALRSDWRPILAAWMDECTDPDRYRRLHTILQRCIYDGTPLEPAPEDVRID